MTDIKLYNTKTRRKEVFEPLDPENIRMYLCGPTVYDRAHLGNARNVLMFDVLFRLMRETYGEDRVTYVRNFTDVDDKINARAAESGRSIGDITDETIGWYHEDMDALGALRPSHEPRATAYIAQMISLIEELIRKGHAYEAQGHVLFSVKSYKDHGSLSGRSLEDMITISRLEVAPYKQDQMDFVLWKPSDEVTPGWASPWGRGRPGWHIECSAMAHDLLGPHFDIHGGGIDLQFPHHENEIAQSKCAGHDFAEIWMHNEMLQVDGKKMAKSVGNFFTVRDLLEEGVPGEVIRFVFLSTHYGKPMDWTVRKRDDARATLTKWFEILSKQGFTPKMIGELKASGAWKPDQEFMNALSDDLNTAGAIARLHVLSRGNSPEDLTGFAYGISLLGLVVDWSEIPSFLSDEVELDGDVVARIDALISARGAAREARDWAEADRIRDLLNAAGVEVTDTSGAAEWVPGPAFDASLIC
jgi:cysteinyl-tRNA synthetase